MPAWHSSVWQLGTVPGANVELLDMGRLSVVGSAGMQGSGEDHYSLS